MMAGRTYGNKLAVSFGLILVFTLLIAATSVGSLLFVVRGSNSLLAEDADNLAAAQKLDATIATRISDYRGYLLTGQQKYLDMTNADRATFLSEVAGLQRTLKDPTARNLLASVSTAEVRHYDVLTPVVARRKSMTDLTDISQLNGAAVGPARDALLAATAALLARAGKVAGIDRKDSQTRLQIVMWAIVVLGLVAVGMGAWVAWRLSRDLRREVGTAVGHIQSSSAQLESAAAQQAAGGRDQASATNEITTTISELLITSRQIAESAQRVSKIAEDTADAARTGDATIDQTRASITAIRSQVDQIVQHMLALGEKSQQIGSVVDLVSELAEQTNILAINATIEASGAGEWGRRFAVVAEEIRKLADRTAGSAKEIRTLIEDVRGAVNTTVMATEIGAKAVDAGSRQFDDATSSFRRIASLVATTSDATREIELSTKQQTTAVEQVNVAAADTARVARENEASAVQTKQTAAHLSTLSGDLLDLVGSAH
jgi:CHASE3 domain sensor protein